MLHFLVKYLFFLKFKKTYNHNSVSAYTKTVLKNINTHSMYGDWHI